MCKKILFIAPKFAGYENELIEVMRKQGYSVDFFPEKSYGKLSVLISKLNITLYNRFQKKYLDSILNKTKTKSYDLLFVIRGEILDNEFLKSLYRQTNIKKKINYQWDSIERNKMLKNTMSLYDEVYSFDRKDCQEHNFIYKPLFYISKYDQEKSDIKYDLLFIGTEHGERVEYINRYKKITEKYNLTFKIILYISFFRFIKNKLFNKNFKNIRFSDVIFNKISIKESYSFISNSKVILDVANNSQTGLTMRTIEALGLEKKIITNNNYIIYDKFYDKNNIEIITNQIKKDFFFNSFEEINLSNLEINEWINDFFN